MAYMLGNTTFYAIVPETTYGVRPVTASAVVLGLNVTMKFNPTWIDRPYKSGTLTDTTCGTILSAYEGAVTLDGAFSIAMAPYIESYLQNTLDLGSDITFGTTEKSFTIYQLDSVHTGSCRYATGCKVKSINISSTAKDYAKATILFVAKDVTDWVTRPAISGSYPTGPTCTDVMLHSDMVVNTRLFDVANISSLTINMDSLLIEDNVRFGTSMAPVNQYMTKKTVNVTVETLFDPTETSHDGIIANMKAQTTRTCQVQFNDRPESKNFVFMLYGMISNYDFADPDAGVWKNSIEIKCMKEGANNAFEVAKNTV